MFVRFLQTRTVKAIDGKTFCAGEVYELPEESARRWLRRGVVEIYAQSYVPEVQQQTIPVTIEKQEAEEPEDETPKLVKKSVGRPKLGKN